jgi:hypothetical protein
MATGNYGVVRPATVTPNDMEVFFTYSPSRDTAPTIPIQRLVANQIITTFKHPTPNNGNIPLFDGLYNLQLPLANFSAKGIYNVIIRPREIRTTITDCGVLSAFPDIKGIVLDVNALGIQDVNSLVGYRIEYYDNNGNRIPNFFRLITSANRAEPLNTNTTNSSQKSVKYRFNDVSNLVFCTLTPSSAPNVRPNQFPFIGSPGQSISITNTFFNPITIEIDMVEYDVETLAYALYGNQTKGIQDGMYTIYDFQNRIYKQYNLFEIQDQFSGEPLYEVRELKSDIDLTKDFNTIINPNTPL